MKRGQFTFYRSYFEAVSQLNKRDATAVLFALCTYALDEEEPELNGIAKAVFALMKPTLDAGRKRAETGSKGGSKTEANGKQNESKTQAKAKQKSSKKEKEGEKENEKEREEEVEIEKEGENECYSPSPVPLGGDVPSRGASDGGRTSFGRYGWVKLSAEEREALLALMGDAELERCIGYVDESAQKTGNKNGWKDWAVVLTACHRDRWGTRKSGSGAPVQPDFQPSSERIRANGAWLDSFLESRKGKEGGHGANA